MMASSPRHKVLEDEMDEMVDANCKPYVLVKAGGWGDAAFYGKWLLAVARAEAFWRELFKDPEFAERIKLLCIVCIPDFGIFASIMLTKLGEYRSSYLINLDSEDGEEFAMMASMGFFLPTDRHYKMAIPAKLTKAAVKTAMIKFAETEDEEFVLHPKRLVSSMPFSEAHAWQRRWRAIDEFGGHSRTLGQA
jgi:hypothetical protein